MLYKRVPQLERIYGAREKFRAPGDRTEISGSCLPAAFYREWLLLIGTT